MVIRDIKRLNVLIKENVQVAGLTDIRPKYVDHALSVIKGDIIRITVEKIKSVKNVIRRIIQRKNVKEKMLYQSRQ